MRRRGFILFSTLLALAALALLAALAPAVVLLRGWLQYRSLERSIVQKMDQYWLAVTVPDREGYLLEDDEVFEVPYLASKLSVQARPTRIYDKDERLVGEFVSERGLYVRDPADLPAFLKRALVATEDGGFYRHHGVHWRSLARAMGTNLRHLKTVQGGSTLTQQLAKMLFTTRQKTFGRKAFELFAARKIEEKFTKDQILLMYLNYAYFGHGCFGVESAARFYFGKPARALQIGEAALLAGIIASPDRYSPFVDQELARARFRTVLKRMAAREYLPASALARIADDFWAVMEGRLKDPEISFWRMSVNKSPTFIERVRRELAREYTKERIMKGGLTVRTTLDLDFQRAAEAALKDGLRRLNEDAWIGDGRSQRAPMGPQPIGTAEVEHGLPRAPMGPQPIGTAEVEHGLPRVEGGFAAVRPEDGAILALVGGSAFNFRNQLNRAADIGRPVGSAVKPFIYAVAFAAGFKPEDTMLDEPASYAMARGKRWTPRNYDGKYHGLVPLAAALQKSLNSVAVKLLVRTDIGRVIRLLSDATGDPQEAFPRNLSLALGTADSSPLKLACAYAVFANGGRAVRPYFLRTVEDRDGKVLRSSETLPAPQILDPDAAWTALQTLRGVLEEGGTAHAAARAAGFHLPAAGKTGTTDDYRDAWFAGVTPELAAAVWVGHDDMRIALGKGMSGGRVAAPIWLAAVKELHRHRPTREFQRPEGMK